MTALDNFGLTRMLAVTGDEWTALTVDCEPFRGIFDSAHEEAPDDNGRTVKVLRTTIQVRTCVADKLTLGTAIVSPTDVTWFVRDVYKLDDGTMSSLQLATTAKECQ